MAGDVFSACPTQTLIRAEKNVPSLLCGAGGCSACRSCFDGLTREQAAGCKD